MQNLIKVVDMFMLKKKLSKEVIKEIQAKITHWETLHRYYYYINNPIGIYYTELQLKLLKKRLLKHKFIV